GGGRGGRRGGFFSALNSGMPGPPRPELRSGVHPTTDAHPGQALPRRHRVSSPSTAAALRPEPERCSTTRSRRSTSPSASRRVRAGPTTAEGGSTQKPARPSARAPPRVSPPVTPAPPPPPSRRAPSPPAPRAGGGGAD